MKLEFQCLIPASTVQYIAKEFSTLNEQSLADLSKNIKQHLSNVNILPETLDPILSDIFQIYHDCNFKMSSSHRRKTLYKKLYPYVAPQKKRLLKQNTFFYYVPIVGTLKALFADKSAAISLDPPIQADPNILSDFTDGKCFKDNKFFQDNPTALRIIIYQDGFELCCAIGPAKRKHKLLGVYMSIGNLPDYLRCHVNNIYLVALCREKEFNHNRVFAPLLKDLQSLEKDGIFVPGYGTVKAALAFIAGDNLGSHALGGSNENFSKSTFFCRYCTVSRQPFHSAEGFHQEWPLRTPESYRECLQGRNIQTRQGVKFDSLFNELSYFHVCNPGLPPSLAHDLFEGIVSHDLVLFIDHFVSVGWFTFEQLNERITSFPYTTKHRRDKPIPQKEGCGKLAGGAMQICNFLILFPLFVNDFIDWEENEGDEIWEAVLLLIEIVQLIMAPYIHVTALAYLDSIIFKYLDLRKRHFPLYLLRPKHHYLLHYPQLIWLFGPLSKVWTLRFESKHQFFNRYITSSRNFINVLSSLCSKHELFMCYLRSGVELRSLIEPFKCVEFNVDMYSLDIQLALQAASNVCFAQECVSIKIKGTEYEKGSLLLVHQTHYQYELDIGRICFIFYDNNDIVHFLVEILKTEFLPHLRMYNLGCRKSYRCIEHSSLLSYSPVPQYKIGSVIYACPRHLIFEKSLQ